MNEPDIAPLARRLAEENNVDWRRLAGSGDGGRIVERDVLGFLARVMAGEEDLDPTPEPVPEGMQAWPEADVAAYRAVRATPAPERSVTDTLDDDLFLFDDATPSSEVPPVFDAEPAAAMPVATVGEVGDGEADDLLLVDDVADEGAASVADAAPVAAPGDEPDDEVVFLTDDLGTGAAPSSPSAELPDLFDAGDDGTAEQEPFGAEAFGTRTQVGPASADGMPPVVDVDAGASDDEALFVAETAVGTDVGTSAAGDAPVVDDLFVPDARAVAAARAVEDDALVGAPPLPEPAASDVGTEPVAAVVPAAPRPVAGPVGDPIAGGAVELVRHGQVWRRRVDDRAFRSAVSQVADALGATPTAVATVLLGRAVAKAWSGPVAVDGWWWEAGAARRGALAVDGALADAIAGVARARDAALDGASPALVVADLAAFGLDEAVLHLDAPLLALGRAAGDGAWLTLSGDDVPHEAVAALGRVAEALGAPIRLLL